QFSGRIVLEEQVPDSSFENRRELLGVELGVDFEQRFESGGVGCGMLQDALERVGHAGVVGELCETEDFLLSGRADELRQDLRNTGSAGFLLERERGQETVF